MGRLDLQPKGIQHMAIALQDRDENGRVILHVRMHVGKADAMLHRALHPADEVHLVADIAVCIEAEEQASGKSGQEQPGGP